LCHKKTAASNHTASQKYKKAGAPEKCRSNKCQRRNGENVNIWENEIENNQPVVAM